jgi:hypothetical protein
MRRRIIRKASDAPHQETCSRYRPPDFHNPAGIFVNPGFLLDILNRSCHAPDTIQHLLMSA